MTHTDTPTSSNTALATPDLIRGSSQRGHSRMRAHPISGLSEIGHVKTRKSGKPDLRCASGYRVSGEDSIIMRKRNA